MSSEPDDDTRAFLAAVRERAAAQPPAPAPAPRRAPDPAPLVRTPPAWLKEIADPPADFKARVAARRRELAAGITQTDQTAPKTPLPK